MTNLSSGVSQPNPLLVTKLYIPPTRSDLVSRQRLTERLNKGLQRKLTLVSAPAGFGKTTLLSEWVASCGRPAAWLTLDEGHNDLVRFLTYFIAALQTIEPTIGDGVLSLLQSPQPPPTESMLTALINEVAPRPEVPSTLRRAQYNEGSGRSFILVLDDYHVIESQPIDNALAFALAHLPVNMHLAISSRADPSLPLSRLRAQGQITEMRAGDLRFTLDEVTVFLDKVMDTKLSPENVAALETRTEGWIAGLQLAALSIQGLEQSGDISSFIESFSGSNRYILDYLIDEVFWQRPKGTKDFLLQTSILDRLSGPLCDTVTERKDSQANLEALEAANLFIVPLDSERRWYRYHHLFADLLRRRLRQAQPRRIPELHHRASEWYEYHELIEEAIQHALAAEDFERAARLIEELSDVLWERGEPTTILGWLEALPDEQVSSRPRLCSFSAWALYMNGQNQAAERWLQAAERALDAATDGLGEVSSEDPGQLNERDKLEQRGRVAAIRASMAFRQGNAPGIFKFSRQALEYLPEKSLMWRCITAMALGMAQDLSGDTEAASRTLTEAVAISKASGNIYLILSTSLHLGTILMSQGRLKQVYEMCQELLQLAEERGVLHTEMAGCLYDELGLVLCEWNDLDDAMRHLKKGSELSERGYDLGVLGWSYLTMLRALFTQGDVAGAEGIIQKMEKMEQESDVPPWYTSPKEAWRARLWLSQGDLDAASQWVQDRGLNVDAELPYLREAEYIVLARILVAQNRLAEALELLERLYKAAEQGGRIAVVAEVSRIQALAHQARGENEAALTALAGALSLVESGGYVRVFVDEGEPMAQLLRQVASRGMVAKADVTRAYVERLLAAFEVSQAKGTFLTAQPLVEPLSERELEVLRLIAGGLSNQEIAQELVIAVGTVKAHTSTIYRKLDVRGRAQAVIRARKLNLL
jgi:LuxR family maltose regulon positive regulatory protein